jgi:hypothetical protein
MLKSICRGETARMDGIEWEIDFSTPQGNYVWRGHFKHEEDPDYKSRVGRKPGLSAVYRRGRERPPELLYESHFKNGEEIFFREGETERFRGAAMPKASSERSFFDLFTGDDAVADVRRGFDEVFTMEFYADSNALVDNALVRSLWNERDYADIEEIFVSDLPILTKLAVIFFRDKKRFEKIKRKFVDIFPNIDDITFFENEDRRYFIVNIREKRTGWIPQFNISSGMFKTLMFITQMSILDGETVVLIDELENSLGLNCIDILQEELSRFDRDDQFIITSHHPYVINNIDMRHWRIVTRDGGVVKVFTAGEIGLGQSSHEAFFQLINSPEYREGIK